MTQTLQKEINAIVDQLVTRYKPDKVILFGSAARGEATEDSDLDFFVIKQDVPAAGRERYYELAKAITYNHASDFLICTPQEVEARKSLSDPFMKQVLTEGKVLYGWIARDDAKKALATASKIRNFIKKNLNLGWQK